MRSRACKHDSGIYARTEVFEAIVLFCILLDDAFREGSDRIKKVKNNRIRTKLEREFSTLRHAKASKLFVERNIKTHGCKQCFSGRRLDQV